MHHRTTLLLAILLLGIQQLCCLADIPAFSFEGRIVETSQLPNPKTSPYTDCLFTLTVAPHSPKASNVLLTLEGFVDRTLTPYATLQPGDLIRIEQAHDFEAMPKTYQSRQIVDDIVRLDLPFLAGITVSKISTFSKSTGDDVLPSSLDHAGGLVPAIPDSSARKARADTMQKDLHRLEAMRADHGSWANWHRDLAPFREELSAKLAATDTEYLQTSRFFFSDIDSSLGFQLLDEDPHYQRVLNALTMMRLEFSKAGTDLIVVPIPIKSMVYAEAFVDKPPADRVLQPYWYKFMVDCLARDIEVVDLMPRFQDDVMKEDVTLYHYNTLDGHPTGQGAIAAAEEISKRLERYTFDHPPIAYSLQETHYRFTRVEQLLFQPDEPFYAEVVLGPDNRYAPSDEMSSILMIGDSMLTAPPFCKGASLGAHVMRLAGIPCTFFKRPGSVHQIGTSLARVQDPIWFSNRKVCILIFAGRYIHRHDAPWSLDRFITPHLDATPEKS